ncbi:calcium-binding protein [Aquabacterium lacunae]|nr:calcium-binding protein [Aquabacterium lacunae]
MRTDAMSGIQFNGNIEITLRQTEEDAPPANGTVVLENIAWDANDPGASSIFGRDDFEAIQLGTQRYGLSALTGLTATFQSVTGSAHADTLRGGSWTDLMEGGQGRDELRGWAGRDSLYGQADDDSLWGGGDDDTIDGGDGNDLLVGGHGNDVLFGAAGTDTLRGGQGRNEYLIDAGSRDVIDNRLGGEMVLSLTQDATFSAQTFDTSQVMHGNGQRFYAGPAQQLVSWINRVNATPASVRFERIEDTLKVSMQDAAGNTYAADILHYWGAEASADGSFVITGVGRFNRQQVEQSQAFTEQSDTYTAPSLASGEALNINALGGDDDLRIAQRSGTIILGDGEDTLRTGALTGRVGDTTTTVRVSDFGQGNSPDHLVLEGAPELGVDDYVFITGDSLAYTANGLLIRDADTYVRMKQGGLSQPTSTSGVVLEGYFNSDRTHLGETVTLPDGTVLDTDQIRTLMARSTANQGLNGTSEADTLKGGIGNDTLIGSGGNDRLDGSYGVNIIAGGDGDDTLIGGGEKDWFFDIAGNDQIFIKAGASAVLGTRHTDQNSAAARIQEEVDIHFKGRTVGDIVDVEQGHLMHADWRSATSWARAIGTGGALNYQGDWRPGIEDPVGDTGAPPEAINHDLRITFKDGSTVYLKDAGNALIQDRVAFDRLLFDDQTLSATDLMRIGTVASSQRTSPLYALPEGSLLDGRNRVQVIGNIGNDTLVSGQFGMDNTPGSDTFVVRSGESARIAAGDTDDAAVSTDRVVFEGAPEGARLATRIFAWSDNSQTLDTVDQYLELTLHPAGNDVPTHRVTIHGLVDPKTRTWTSALDEVSWGAQSPLKLADVFQQTHDSGREGVLVMHPGFSQLTGSTGNDTLYGSTGDDVLSGAAGNNLVLGGRGQDTLVAAGTSDTLDGGTGADTYVIANDAVEVRVKGSSEDTVKLPNGIRLDQIAVTVNAAGNIHTLSFEGLPTRLTIEESAAGGQTQVAFSDGSTMSLGTLFITAAKGITVTGSGLLEGTAGNDTLVGSAANDTLIGQSGLDDYTGGPGNDIIITGANSDTIRYNLGDGRDLVTAGYNDVIELGWKLNEHDVGMVFDVFPRQRSGHEIADVYIDRNPAFQLKPDTPFSGYNFRFQDGYRKVFLDAWSNFDATLFGLETDDVLSSNLDNLTIKGLGGNDTLTGSPGYATLDGGTGNDLLVFHADALGGRARVTYQRGDGEDTIQLNGARLELTLGEGIQQADLSVKQSLQDPTVLRLVMPQGNGHIIMTGVSSPKNVVLNFSDQSSILLDSLPTTPERPLPLELRGTDSQDMLVGGDGADTLTGLADNDTLNGGLDADQLTGGQGHDEISGGEGADTVFFNVGDGLDLIHADSLDTLSFGSGITQNSLQLQAFTASDTALTFAVGTAASTDRITLDNAGTWDGLAVQFADGTATSGAALLQAARDLAPLNLQGTDAAEALTGKNGADTLFGGGGNDSLSGGLANDQLTGGLGNDEITGGEGADTVFFNAGDGQDLLHADGLDALVLGAGLTRSSLQLSQLPTTGGSELSLGFAGRTDRITLDQLGSWDGLTVQFADGTRTTGAALIQEARVQPLTLKGTSGKDMLTGQSKADNLSGLAGNDTLIGNQGNDTLIGGSGADTYRFKRGDGQDTLIETDISLFSKDVLAFGDVAANQLWFTRSGQSLVVSVIGTQDRVTVQDWFKGSAYRVEAFTSSDGKSLSSSKVNSLVSAMAKFSAPAEGTTTLPTATAKALQPVLASSWV